MSSFPPSPFSSSSSGQLRRSGRWYVESDQGWMSVDAAYNGVLEGAFRRGDATCSVDSSLSTTPFNYTVRFLQPTTTATAAAVHPHPHPDEAVQTNDATGRTRTLRRFPVTDYVWQYHDASPSATDWKTYPNTELLEYEYGKAGEGGETVVVSPSSGQPIHIDMRRLVERNCVTGLTKPVRRIAAAPSAPTMPGAPTAPVPLPSAPPMPPPLVPTADATVAPSAAAANPDSHVWRRVSASSTSGDGPQCPICHDTMDTASEHVVELRGCSGHMFHRDCIRPVLKPTGSLKCPLCSAVSGTPNTGNQPPGTMTVSTLPSDRHGVRGVERNLGVIVIRYSLPSGAQTTDHPHPGVRYSGTERKAYLPDDSEGREVLRLLRIAWERRLIFTVGRSVTTGKDDCVVWNGIHHKTSVSGGPYGYPDETYLARVKDELKGKGVE